MLILITSYNRPDYLRSCLSSLERTYLPKDAMIYIIDDGSDGGGEWLVRYKSSCAGSGKRHGRGEQVLYPKIKAQGLIKSGLCEFVEERGKGSKNEIERIIKGFKPGCKVKTTFKPVNAGLYDSIITGHKWAFSNGYDYVVTLADDIIVNNWFYSYMTYYRAIFPDNIISGFNTLTLSELGTPRHPIEENGGWYLKKKTSGSACIGINEQHFNDYFLPAIKERLHKQTWYDTLATKLAYEDGKGVVCTVPSVAQHIGVDSKMGHGANIDVAYNFDMIFDPERKRDKIVSVNIATYPARESCLRELISRIRDYHVIDKIRVYLNEYDHVPEFLQGIETHIGENLKDSGKFYWAEELHNEYYFTLDDDILPDETYFVSHISLLEEYGNIPFVTSHGKVLRPTPADFRDFSELYRCKEGFKGNHWINFPGTGVMVFDNSRYCFPMFNTHGMADLHIAKYLQQNRIPCIARGHEKHELKMLYLGKDTLWAKRDEMKQDHADILNSIDIWRLFAITG